MRTKNKMKDSETKSEEWWEFVKELKKNLTQHKDNERILRYKLEVYQKNFQDFICGSPTSTKVSGQDEEIKVGLSGTIQEEEVQTKESQDLRSGVAQEEKVQPKIPQDLKGRGQEKRTKRNLETKKGEGYSNIRKKDIQDPRSGNITTN
jgi:hypothetical protein